MSGLFGKKPSSPNIVSKPQPVRVELANQSKQAVYEQMAKRRRATILNDYWKPENRNKLGAG